MVAMVLHSHVTGIALEIAESPTIYFWRKLLTILFVCVCVCVGCVKVVVLTGICMNVD